MSIFGQNALLNQYTPTYLIRQLTDRQILMYDSTKHAFINVDPEIVVSEIVRLGQLINVAGSVDNSASVQNGMALVWNSFTQLWQNQFVDYTTLLNKPTSVDFSFIGLSDTAKPSLQSGYVLWNSAGDQLVYSTTIPASSITGLASVATTGNFNDLTNKPTSGSYSFIGLADTAKPALPNTILKWDNTGSNVIYVSSIPVTQITGLAPVATAGTFGSLTNVSPSADTLNNTTDGGKSVAWTGSSWSPVNPAMRVVANLSARDALSPSLGNQSFVINSDDGMGDYQNQWSLWIYTISGTSNGWTLLSRQETGTAESATIEVTFGPTDTSPIIIGTLPTGGRITLITVEVTTPFNGAPALTLGYEVDNPSNPAPVPAGLMASFEIDLTVSGTYSTESDILFGVDTLPGDVEIFATFTPGGATVGSAQIIVSYV